jgi:small-conductance mechanosensitive channel
LVDHFKSAVLILLLLTPVTLLTAQAQTAHPIAATDTLAKDQWSTPDLLNLPPDWLSRLESVELDEDRIQSSLDQFVILAKERIQGLNAQNRVEAEVALVSLQNNAASLLAAVQEAPETRQVAVPSQDSYTLEEFLSLRGMWRDTNAGLELSKQELDEARQHYRVLRGKYDSLVMEYNGTDPGTPSRVIVGLGQLGSGIKLLAIGKSNAQLEARLRQLENRIVELNNKIDYARTHLVPGDISSGNYDFAIASANEALAKIDVTKNTLQNRLLESISQGRQADNLTQLKLKQQLTLASAREALLMVNRALDTEKKNWYLLSQGVLDSATEVDKNTTKSIELVRQVHLKSEVWTSTSRTTIITPAPSPLQGVQAETYSEALEAARESFEVIKNIDNSIDDLGQVQELAKAEVVGQGLGGVGIRLTLLASAAWRSVQEVTGFKLFYIGDTPVTPGSLVRFVLIVAFGYLLSWILRLVLLRVQRRREQTAESSSFYTLGRVLHYVIMTITVLVAFDSLGLDISNLALIASALSVGIGFGLQSIVNNFLSGLILLFEGSLKVGDFIELDSGVSGVVKEFSTRYTRINTNDNVDIVVPNSDLVNFKLTNWTLREPVVRVRIPFGVAYGTDKELVRKAALEAADEVQLTMKAVPGRTPDVLLVNFGDSSLDFELQVWVSRQGVHRPVWGKAAYYWALETKFREYGIEIPFPQRDLYMRGIPAQE